MKLVLSEKHLMVTTILLDAAIRGILRRMEDISEEELDGLIAKEQARKAEIDKKLESM